MGEYVLKYHPKVVSSDIPSLDTVYAKRIKNEIERKLTANPNIFGKPLRSELSNCKKIRVGDYRVIFTVIETTVFIYLIDHRKSAYKNIRKRL